jgi:hypothetical protein
VVISSTFSRMGALATDSAGAPERMLEERPQAVARTIPTRASVSLVYFTGPPPTVN